MQSPHRPRIGVQLAQAGARALSSCKGCALPIPSRPDSFAIDGIDLQVAPGANPGGGRPLGGGQVDAVRPAAALFRPARGAHPELMDSRSSGSTPPTCGSSFALVSQNPALFFGTVEDNIRYGRMDASLAEVEAAAKVAHAHGFIMKLPTGLPNPSGRCRAGPVWRPAAAPGDCPGAAGGCADSAAG